VADKLSASIWSSYAKKSKLELDDGALLKALARFDKTDDTKPEPRQEALKEVIEQIKKLLPVLLKKKKELGDKPLNETKDKLNALLDAAEVLHKQTLQAQATSSAADDDADSSTLMTSAMVPLIRQLLKGEVQMHALIARTSKKVAVLIRRRPISPSYRKILAQYLLETSGIKYIAAECAGESGQLRFLLDTSPSGLSKKLRLAIFEQTGLRTKVIAQFEDEAETDSDSEDVGTTEGKQDSKTESDPGANFKTRLIDLLPRIKSAATANHPAAQDIKLKTSEAGVLAGKKDFPRANQRLDEVEALLIKSQATDPASAPTEPKSAQAEPARATSGSINPQVAFTQSRLAWDQTRKKIQSDLRKLEAAILAKCQTEPFAKEVAAGTKNLYALLDHLDERLIDKLDEALNASEPILRKARHVEARHIVDEYLEFVASNPLMRDIDNNGFESTSILPAVNASLKLISTRLAAV
jgi:hypothetical protein